MSSTFEVSDEEAPAACPLVPVQPAVEVAWKASGTHEHQEEEGIVLTRSMQLALAESRKRKRNKKSEPECDDDDDDEGWKPRKLRRGCLSKQSLALARRKNKKAKAKAGAKKKPTKQTKAAAAKCKASAKPKVNPKARAKGKAKAKAQPGKSRIPGNATIKRFHGLKFKQAKCKDDKSFGEVPKDQRDILKKEIHVSKMLLGLHSYSFYVATAKA